jgi:hypothetical protein
MDASANAESATYNILIYISTVALCLHANRACVRLCVSIIVKASIYVAQESGRRLAELSGLKYKLVRISLSCVCRTMFVTFYILRKDLAPRSRSRRVFQCVRAKVNLCRPSARSPSAASRYAAPM